MITRELLRHLALVLTPLLGMGIAWAAICRLNASSPTLVRPRVRAQFAVLLGVGMALVVSPAAPRWAVLFIVAAGLFAFVVMGMYRWRSGVPPELRSDRPPNVNAPPAYPRPPAPPAPPRAWR